MKSKKLSVILLGLLYSSTNVFAVEMTDYKLVDSFYDESYVGMSFDLKSGNQEQTSYNGTFTGQYNARSNSKELAWDMYGNGQINISKGPNDTDKSQESYDFLTGGHVDKYLDGYEKLFVFGAGDLGYRKRIGIADADDPYVKLGVGLGYGRMYEATPLAKALRIAEDLQSYNIVNKLNDTTLLSLAKLIDKEDEFKSKFGIIEYKKFWLSAIETVLKTGGALKSDTLGAFGIIRIDEILFDETISARYHGWIVRAGSGYILSN